ncbi:hypothetical protein [Deinococcus cellulosilyticus]|uniref:Uncharacterized protein n=1 Tax=Deinococcus cellulosilyticus (strain DSM 18568 / NBRC 106333 / KACC 11606 / 5516J-15) TaxID=1223518 RepID=A0A511NCG3_DEIC1|nr:hypothetical protein [Deinococcus cellulosilyticus]GEM50031.1 hypothetical protein DC3_56660 [Deinococcus cellulosilyticus NBRC 106333 = KACC 11606]
MGEYLQPDTQSIKVGGVLLPGIITGIEVSGELRLEKQKTDGKSGSTTLLKGFEEASIRVSLELLAGDSEIKSLEKVFKGYASALKSKGVRVVNRHLDARGVKLLVFKKLTTRDDYARGMVVAELEFSEYDMEAARLEDKDAAGSGLGSGLGNGTGSDGQNNGKGNDGKTGKAGVSSPVDQLFDMGAKGYTLGNNVAQNPLGTLGGMVGK